MFVQIKIILQDGLHLHVSRITLLLVSLDSSCAEKEKNKPNALKGNATKAVAKLAMALYSLISKNKCIQ